MVTAIVTAGAGARGAYEAGVLSIVVPRLVEEGHDLLLLGTSAGAINTAIIAGQAGADRTATAEAVARQLDRVWREIDVDRVFRLRPPIGRYLARFVGARKSGPYSFLDASPLEATIDHGGYIDWHSLPEKFTGTWLRGAGVVATKASSGRSIVFCEGIESLPPDNVARGIDYAPARLTGTLVRASAAIPVVFPSVKVPDHGWCFDGGVRLNTPISPAIDLLFKLDPDGDNRMIVVATHPDPTLSGMAARPDQATPTEQTDVFDEGATIMRTLLVDRLAEDLLSLRRVNAIMKSAKSSSLTDPRGGQDFRVIPHQFFGPDQGGHIASCARDCFASKNGRWSLSSSSLISQALGRTGPSHDELLSFLLFDRDYLSALVDMGRRDALQSLEDGFVWRDAVPPVEAAAPERTARISGSHPLANPPRANKKRKG